MNMTRRARRRLVILVLALGLPLTVLAALTLFLLSDGLAWRLAEAWRERFPGRLQVSGLRLAAVDAIEAQGIRIDDDQGRPVLALEQVALHGRWRQPRLHGARVDQARLVLDAPALAFWRQLAAGLDEAPMELVLPQPAVDARDTIQIDRLDIRGPDGRQAQLALRIDHDAEGRRWLIEGHGDYGHGELILRDRPAAAPDLLSWTIHDLDPSLSRALLGQVLARWGAAARTQALLALLDWPVWSSSGMISRDDDQLRLALVATCDHPLLPRRIDLRGSLTPVLSLATTLHWADGQTAALHLGYDQGRWHLSWQEGSIPWDPLLGWANALLPPALAGRLNSLPLQPRLSLAGSSAEGHGQRWHGRLAAEARMGLAHLGLTASLTSAWQYHDAGLHLHELHLDSPLVQLGPATAHGQATSAALHWQASTLTPAGALWLDNATGLNSAALIVAAPQGSLHWDAGQGHLRLTGSGADSGWQVDGTTSADQPWTLSARQMPVTALASPALVAGTVSSLDGQWRPGSRAWHWQAGLDQPRLGPSLGRYQVSQARLSRSHDQAWTWHDAQLRLAGRPSAEGASALTLTITDLAPSAAAVAEAWTLPALAGRLHGTMTRSPGGSLHDIDLQVERLAIGPWLGEAQARVSSAPDDPAMILIALSQGHLPLAEQQLALDRLDLRWQDRQVSGTGRLAGGSPLGLEASQDRGRWQARMIIDPLQIEDLVPLLPQLDPSTPIRWAWPLALHLGGDQDWSLSVHASLYQTLLPGQPWTMTELLDPRP